MGRRTVEVEAVANTLSEYGLLDWVALAWPVVIEALHLDLPIQVPTHRSNRSCLSEGTFQHQSLSVGGQVFYESPPC